MSLPSVDCVYLREDFVKELKNANSNYKFPSPVPVLRFLYELCFTMVLLSSVYYILQVVYPGLDFFGHSCVFVRGDLPFQKCKAALEAVEFLDCGPEGDVGSYFADVVTQMAQDVSYFMR
ncbi:hypothetical protein RD792_011326 [Penstemon davidsonii]|uniref:Uncharacterized protein n=1 Tax=Penstemon davidsonii TaxID=160366 RepID=A0ABR0D5N7_9LAMI|nr:hypothetical protein RD792_011326 [Penstemon davidsonii]